MFKNATLYRMTGARHRPESRAKTSATLKRLFATGAMKPRQITLFA